MQNDDPTDDECDRDTAKIDSEYFDPNYEAKLDKAWV